MYICAGWELYASDVPLPGQHETPRSEDQHDRRAVRHRSYVRDTAREAEDVSGATVSDQTTLDASADLPL